jgi:hypothetical protein
MSGRSPAWRFVVPLIALVMLAVPVIGQAKSTAKKSGLMKKEKGTLSAVDIKGSDVTLTLAGGAVINIPVAKLKVIDQRGGKHKKETASFLSVGQKVIVKTRTNPKGEVRTVKVKVTG